MYFFDFKNSYLCATKLFVNRHYEGFKINFGSKKAKKPKKVKDLIRYIRFFISLTIMLQPVIVLHYVNNTVI